MVVCFEGGEHAKQLILQAFVFANGAECSAEAANSKGFLVKSQYFYSMELRSATHFNKIN